MALNEISLYINGFAKTSQNNIHNFRNSRPSPDCECGQCLSSDFRKIPYLQSWEMKDADREYRGLVD